MLTYVILYWTLSVNTLFLSPSLGEGIEKGQLSPQGVINYIDLLIDNTTCARISLTRAVNGQTHVR